MRLLDEKGPSSSDYAGLTDERQRFKSWFNSYRYIFELSHVIDSWMKDCPGLVSNFIADFEEAYNTVAKRTSAPELPNGR